MTSAASRRRRSRSQQAAAAYRGAGSIDAADHRPLRKNVVVEDFPAESVPEVFNGFRDAPPYTVVPRKGEILKCAPSATELLVSLGICAAAMVFSALASAAIAVDSGRLQSSATVGGD